MNDLSADSLSSGRNTHNTSQYHFHGLAQTQSQLHGQDSASSQFQKETLDDNRRGLRSLVDNKTSLSMDQSTKDTRTRNDRQEQHRAKEIQISQLNSEKLLNMNLHGHHHHTSVPRRIKPPSRPRSPSESSQDSFAVNGVDPERQFLASTKQFQVPLSELGRNTMSGPSNPSGSVGENSGSSLIVYPPLTRSSRASHSPQGHVLVAATPSETGRSQEQEQHARQRHQSYNDGIQGRVDSDKATVDDEINSQNSNSSSAPGSSLYEPHDQAQAADIQATQPSTQPDDTHTTNSPDPPWLLAAAKAVKQPTSGESSMPKSSVSDETKSTTGGRTLLSLINPRNQWRFQRCHNIMMEAQNYHNQAENDTAQQNLVGQETRPSFEAQVVSQVDPPKPARQSNSSPRIRREQYKAPPTVDAMDIVSDSEPSREEPPSLVAHGDQRQIAADHHMPVQQQRIHVHNRIPQCSDHEKDGNSKQNEGVLIARRRREEDDGDDEDDDVPLAEIAAKTGRKATERSRVTGVPSAGASKRSAHVSRQVREWAEVPSSVPEQDTAATNTRTRLTRSGANNTKNKFQATKSNKPSASVTNSRKLRRLDEETKEFKSDREGDQQPIIKRRRETEELTDEGHLDIDVPASSRKRKRGTSLIKAPSTRGKGVNAKASKPVVAASSGKLLHSKQTKKLRSMTASASRTINVEATRVFALWRQDGHFYSGIVHSLQQDNRYLVKFDDETEAVVNLEQMRSCELHTGDDVLLPGRTRSSKVMNLSMLEDDVVIVGADGEEEEVHVCNLRIASRTIKSAWKDRLLTPQSVVPVVLPNKTGESPTPSEVTSVSAPSTRGDRRKFLSKTGLVVTLSAGSGNWEKEKESLLGTIRSNGGVVLDDLASIIKMEGKHAHNNNRWVLNKDEVHWNTKEDVERVFLLADDSNQKPKFLIAVGLGIPCLSVNWLHESTLAGEEKEWTTYMLPQGYSDTLGARISQQVDVDWGNSVHQLTDIMDNAVPAKVFHNQSILCVGSDMVPQPKGKRLAGTDEKTQEASNAVARIIMCMGPCRVEAITELRYASVRLSDYDYIVVKDTSLRSIDAKGCTVVPWSWVKDCLIASRRLPVPDHEQGVSQEA
ncbi:hypothetical protein AX17_003445 [Amanita inopinata Kibby_2008]|nr:hypothetical protein AX17_003445 [Amanita inopinata Kibby_2008]